MRLFIALLLLPVIGYTQSGYIRINSQAEDIISRLDVINSLELPIHTGIRSYNRKDVAAQALLLLNANNTLSSDLNKKDLSYLIEENIEWNDLDTADYELSNSSGFEKVYHDSLQLFYSVEEKFGPIVKTNIVQKRNPVLKHFYGTEANMYELDTRYLQMKFNPILNIKFGTGQEEDKLIFQNTRGLEIRGYIDDKVYFYTSLLENQGNFYNYIEERIDRYQAIPGFGSFKNYQSKVVDRFNGYDYPNSQAYVGFNVSKHISIELGHGRHFIGHGYQSLLLSDYANNYFYLKFNTKVWKLHYQNIFAELNPISARQNPGDMLLPKKYMASHYLSIKPLRNLEIGLFETVMFSRENNFELQYLNPVIFYRTVEFFLDSPDNVILGLNAKWNPVKDLSLYGQFVLDEFKLNELLDASGWWANKYGYQIGLKYYDLLGIDHFDIQLEHNVVRPYTYTHRTSITGFEDISLANYSHQNQPLAHPLGANFKEYIAILKYKPTYRLELITRAMYAQYGDSTDGNNWGNNILEPHGTRVMEFGNDIAQGIGVNVLSLSLDASYQFFHNYYLDLKFLYRNKTSEDSAYSINTRYIGGGIRANISRMKIDY